MKHLMSLLKIFLPIALALFSVNTFAQESCHGLSQIVIQVQGVNYLPGTPDGAPLSAQMLSGSDKAFICNKNSGDTGLNYKDIGYAINAEESGLQTSITDGHNTPIYRIPGVEGIGFAIGFKEPTYCAGRFYDTEGKGKRRSICNSVTSSQISQASQLSMQSYIVFYKIPSQNSPLHPGNQPTTVAESNIGTATLQTGDDATSSQTLADKPQILLSSFTIRYGSCAVVSSQPTINVDMGKVSKSEFKGVGSKGGSERNFQIQVTCENKALVRVGFFGPVESSDKDALALTPQSNSASGVGVALSYGPGLQVAAGQRVALNTPTDQLPVLTTVTSPGQTQTMAFKAQYIQTDAQISAGKADATATFNLVYN